MTISENLNKDFAGFLASVPARRLKINTFRILLHYFRTRRQTHQPDFADDLVSDLAPLFALLDSIDHEVDQSHLL
jgi:hypothetical protein